ncbi:NAD-dependent epimerase/dehydratase family protein [Burkholderia ubonensis]|uniref:NAD-dependent epimerase/dehydratase family protein n=1 Tax=Burkholderia ubonensis TaxID=101571 RepID=UPI000841D8EF|nr:NAD-dependent epimerase/dehydratase family protein [Burkholderia ubonensis]AOK58428.1 epimerase [Burkholderia ubonensis]MDY7790068.1 NAD-dependent epimerase/dehydratase family protein [Burkholderia ubonensis]
MRKPFPEEDLDLVVSHTAEVWSSLRGARLFITGGTGFIGSWLLETVLRANRIARADIEIVALSRDPERARSHAPHVFDAPGVRLVQGDVTYFEIDPEPIDLCIHAATDVADLTKAGNALRVFDTNVLGTRKVLEFSQANGASRFLLTSSGAVYGRQPPEIARMSETYPGAPDTLDANTAYSQGKRAAEWLVAAYSKHHGLNAAIARIYALIGPGIPLDGPFAAGNFIRDALAGRQIAILGDGRPLRSYLYMADACIWLLRILASDARGRAFNVGSEREISIVELARMVEQCCGADVAPMPRLPSTATPAPRYIPDTTLARETLKLDEFTSLELALSKTVNWYRNAVTA